MIEIKPVAYSPREDWSRFDSESRLFPLWEVERDAANLGYYEPLYAKQSIDALRAEVAAANERALRAEAQAAELREALEALVNIDCTFTGEPDDDAGKWAEVNDKAKAALSHAGKGAHPAAQEGE